MTFTRTVGVGLAAWALVWPCAPSASTQNSGKSRTASSFVPSQVEILLLSVEKQEEDLDKLIPAAARGWTIFKEVKAAAGKAHTYVLVADPAQGDVADPASFVPALRSYVASAPGNLLKAEARLPLDAGSGSTPAVPPTSAAPGEAEPSQWTFTGDAGLILFFVKPPGRAQFESVLDKVRLAWPAPGSGSDVKVNGSTTYRISDSTSTGLLIYAVLVAPAVHGVNYAFAPLLGRALAGAALQQVYSDYAAAIGSANLFDLKYVAGGT
jgi:hypothetical protein